MRLTQGLTVRVGTFSPQQLTTPISCGEHFSRTSNTETHHHSSSEIKDKKHSNTICVSIIITIKEKKWWKYIFKNITNKQVEQHYPELREWRKNGILAHLSPRLVLSSTRIHTHSHTHSKNSPLTCRTKVIVVGHVVVIGNQMCQNYCHRPTIVEKKHSKWPLVRRNWGNASVRQLRKKSKILLSINQFMQLSSETIYSSSV